MAISSGTSLVGLQVVPGQMAPVNGGFERLTRISTAAADPILKSWGLSRPLFLSDQLELVEIVAKKGGYSSRHAHQYKHNAFLVVKGRLQLTSYGGGDETQRILTVATGPYVVPAGVDHRFIAIEEPTMAYEMYFSSTSTPVNPDDIVRRDCGGIVAPQDWAEWEAKINLSVCKAL